MYEIVYFKYTQEHPASRYDKSIPQEGQRYLQVRGTIIIENNKTTTVFFNIRMCGNVNLLITLIKTIFNVLRKCPNYIQCA